MDLENPVVQLCIASTRAEFAGNLDLARALCLQAWEASRDDYEACIAAHYLARYQEKLLDRIRWDEEALRRAQALPWKRVGDFFPSLYLSLGLAYEQAGRMDEANQYYRLASELGVTHQDESTHTDRPSVA